MINERVLSTIVKSVKTREITYSRFDRLYAYKRVQFRVDN